MSRVREDSPAGLARADEATRGSAVKLAAEVLSRLLTVASTFVLVRGLGVERLGSFSGLWVLAPILAELGEMGLQATATRALVADTRSLAAFVKARLFLLGLLATLGVAAAAFAPSLVSLLPPWLRVEAPEVGVLVLLVFHFVLAGWAEFFGVALRCRGARVAEAGVLLSLRGAVLAFVVLALLLGAGLAGVGLALLLSSLPAILLGALLLRRHPAGPPAPDAPVARVLREALPLAVYGALLLAGPRVEFLVVWALRGDRETALFFSALAMLWPLALVPSAVAAGAMPALTREALLGGSVVRRRTAATVALFAAPSAVGLVLVAPGLVPLVFGSDFARAAVWVRILALALVPMFLNGLVAWALIAAGRSNQPPRLVAARIAVSLALALVLVPRFGATGAAASFVAAETVMLALGARACAAAGFRLPLAGPVAIALLASIPMALAVRGVPHSPVGAVAVGVLTYAATLAVVWHLFPRLWAGVVSGASEGKAPLERATRREGAVRR